MNTLALIGVAIVSLLCIAEAGKIPGLTPYVHYIPDPSHSRQFRTLNVEEEGFEIECSEAEDIIEGIPITFTNGSCHNLEDPGVGASQRLHIRLLDAAYIDGRGQQDGRNRPGPREISNSIFLQEDGLDLNIKEASRLLIFFGQFIDHDFALVLEQEEPEVDEDDMDAGPPFEEAAELVEVEIPEGDENFIEPMLVPRSEFCFDENFVRQFEAELTPWLDLGTVYGDTQNRTDSLRAFTGGRMTVQQIDGEDFPPQDEISELFLCGDVRCEENAMLFAWHVLWLRNHNYWADEFQQDTGLDPIADDDIIFENARIRNINEYQFLVWTQYLPYLLGRRTFEELTGPYRYDPEEDPTCTLVFTTAVFRYGHSGVSNDLQFLDENLDQTRPTVALADAFFGTEVVLDEGRVGELFVGQGSIAHDILDTFVVSGIRNNVFPSPLAFLNNEMFDLTARNIVRGRDHGMQTINAYREEFGLDPYECPNDPMDCFNQLTDDEDIAEALFELYGDISQCEMWPCGMAETSFEDSLLGETFTVIMSDQFNRMRNADRIWYDNTGELRDTEFAPLSFPIGLLDIVERNTEITVPQDNSFMVASVWLAFATEETYQVEWFEPPSVRESLDYYTITASASVGGTETFQVDRDATLFVIADAVPGAVYTVTVDMNLEGGDVETLGMTTFNAPGPITLTTGAIVGIAIGAGVGGLLLIGGGVWLVKRRNSGGETFL